MQFHTGEIISLVTYKFMLIMYTHFGETYYEHYLHINCTFYFSEDQSNHIYGMIDQRYKTIYPCT